MKIDTIIRIIKETDPIFFDDKLRSDVRKKGDCDFVTKADEAVSLHLHKRLLEEFPYISFVSEEEETKVPEKGECWILDPIDGTTNFMTGLPLCCISLALCKDGESVIGIIYSPYSGELFTAERGGGAYLNGQKIAVSGVTSLSDCVGLLELNAYYKNEADRAMEHARKIFTSCRDLRTLGSAALSFAYIASGRCDVYLGRYLKPWDMAAGILLVTEAGGRVGGLNRKLDLTEPRQHVLASNSDAFDEFNSLLCK
mgnify:CR=1 FL=1